MPGPHPKHDIPILGMGHRHWEFLRLPGDSHVRPGQSPLVPHASSSLCLPMAFKSNEKLWKAWERWLVYWGAWSSESSVLKPHLKNVKGKRTRKGGLERERRERWAEGSSTTTNCKVKALTLPRSQVLVFWNGAVHHLFSRDIIYEECLPIERLYAWNSLKQTLPKWRLAWPGERAKMQSGVSPRSPLRDAFLGLCVSRIQRASIKTTITCSRKT